LFDICSPVGRPKTVHPRRFCYSTAVELQKETEKQWRDWCRKLAQGGIEAPLGAAFQQRLLRVWEASEYVAQVCLRHPELLPELDRAGHACRRLKNK